MMEADTVATPDSFMAVEEGRGIFKRVSDRDHEVIGLYC
jgi:hypothetical protein